jgi:5'-deoxynucleotidase YfbR-like HD superfamily hydrolase
MTQATPDIHRLIDFHRLLLQLQAVDRVPLLPNSDTRSENDVEHSYNLAMAVWFLSEYFPGLDRSKVIRYAMAHDLLEIHAGDTYIYADQAILDTKAEREAAAVKQLEKDWGGDFPDLLNTIHEYEGKSTEEAKFVYALDKIMPIILIFIGQGYTWQKEKITLEQLHAVKKDKVALSPEVNQYYKQLYKLLQDHQHYFTGQKH